MLKKYVLGIELHVCWKLSTHVLFLSTRLRCYITVNLSKRLTFEQQENLRK